VFGVPALPLGGVRNPSTNKVFFFFEEKRLVRAVAMS
jgi:hypothetical protein